MKTFQYFVDKCCVAFIFIFIFNPVLLISQEFIFFGDNVGNSFSRANLDGSDCTSIYNSNTPRGITADYDNKILYFLEGDLKAVKKVGFNGEGAQTLSTLALVNPSQIILDSQNEYLYVSDFGAGKIVRMDIDGNNMIDIITGLTTPRGVIIDAPNNKIYYSESLSDSKIYSANLDGSNQTLLFTTGSDIYVININFLTGKIYWSDNTYSEIRRANLDGTNIETVVAGVGSDVGDIDLDLVNNKMYWAERMNNRIRTSDLDGNNVSVFKDDILGISNMALSIPTVPSTNTDTPSLDFYLKIYPNPAQSNSEVNLTFPVKVPENIILLNRLGQKVWNWTPNKSRFSTKIQLPLLASDLYFIQCKMDNKLLTEKIFIN